MDPEIIAYMLGRIIGGAAIGALIGLAVFLFNRKKGNSSNYIISFAVPFAAISILMHYLPDPGHRVVGKNINQITVSDIEKEDIPQAKVYTAIRTHRPDVEDRINNTFSKLPNDLTYEQAAAAVRPFLMSAIVESVPSARADTLRNISILSADMGEYIIEHDPELCLDTLMGTASGLELINVLPKYYQERESELIVELLASYDPDVDARDPNREERVAAILIEFLSEADHGFDTYDDAVLAISADPKAVEQFGYERLCRVQIDFIRYVESKSPDPAADFLDLAIYGQSGG